jgi:arylsulfatase A-like enzyme
MAKQNGSSLSSSPPNILFVMADDIGWFNVGAYHRGMMAGRTPNIDRLAAEGVLFTDYYAEATCRAGHANFLTGQLAIRTGLTSAGADGGSVGMPAEVPTIATALRSLGYATGQFGQNHLGDRNESLPTLHGFDEFFGHPHHLEAAEDPTCPGESMEALGPRNMLHCWSSELDDRRVDPRWGRVGRQRIQDVGPLFPRRMETVDEEILGAAVKFIDGAREQGKPFFVCLVPTRMHLVTHLSEKYEKRRTPENGWGPYEAGMAQLDDVVGALLEKLADDGLEEDTIVVFTSDTGPETFTWPDGGQTPFAGGKGTVMEGGFRVPCLVRWPGRIPAGRVENALMSGLDWFPTLVAAAGNPNIVEELGRGRKLGARSYRAHLDGYDQLALLTGDKPGRRNEIYYFNDTTLGAVRIGDYKYRFIDEDQGWLGRTLKVEWPLLTNLRIDPFERAGLAGSWEFSSWGKYEYWRFVFVQQEVARLGSTFVAFPPLRPPVSFNLDAIKQQVARAMQVHHGA